MSRGNRKTLVGVIGVGEQGRHHVKHLAGIPAAELVGVFDTDTPKCEQISRQYGVTCYPDLDSLIAESVALVIVTPTPQHAPVAQRCVAAGRHVFIEKPITKTVTEADHLLELAREKGVLVQVGHIERLNPALTSLADFALDPKFIEVQRLAPYTSRGTDVPVVLDLMIHDIDIVLALAQSAVKNISANGVSIMTTSVDIANARIRFENGTVASMTSSRVAKDKVRKIKIFQRDLYVTIDFLLGLTELYRVVDASKSNPRALMSAPLEQDGKQRLIVYEKPPVQQRDALQLELENFIAAVQGEAEPIVDGQAGREALDIATRIHDLILEDLH